MAYQNMSSNFAKIVNQMVSYKEDGNTWMVLMSIRGGQLCTLEDDVDVHQRRTLLEIRSGKYSDVLWYLFVVGWRKKEDAHGLKSIY